jgi:hypothetical protein
MPHTENSQRVTIAVAAKMTGLSPTKIREWLKEPGLDAVRNEQGWWLIDRTTLLARAASDAHGKDSRRGAAATSQAVTSHSREVTETSLREAVAESLEQRIRDLQTQLAREQRLNDELREENRRLASAQTQHLAELRAVLENGAKEKGILSRWIRT